MGSLALDYDELWLDFTRNRFGDLVLKHEDVLEFTVKPVSPYMISSLGIDELGADANPSVSAGDISPLISGIKCPPNSSTGDIFQLCVKRLEEPRCSSGRTG